MLTAHEKLVLIIGITISILVLAASGFLVYQRYLAEPTISPAQLPTEDKEIDISTWQTYRNEKYGFEVRYPGDWRVPLDNDRGAWFIVDPSLKRNPDIAPIGDIAIYAVSNPSYLSMEQIFDGESETNYFKYASTDQILSTFRFVE